MFEAVYKLVASNKNNPLLTGFRLNKGILCATNIVTDVSLPNDALKDIDCYVNAQTLVSSLRNVKTTELSQKGQQLKLKDGNYEIQLPLLDPSDFPKLEPLSGGTVSIKSLVGSLKLLKPFLRNTKQDSNSSLLYIIDGYMYYTDSMLLVRTLVDVRSDELIVLNKEFVDLCVDLKDEPTELLLTPIEVSLLYADGGWVRTSQTAKDPPLDFPRFCSFLEELEIDPTDEGFLENLIRMCKMNTDGIIWFSKSEVSLAGKGKIVIKRPPIDTLDIQLHTKLLKKVLEVAHSVNFSYSQNMIVFRGPGVEGLLSTNA